MCGYMSVPLTVSSCFDLPVLSQLTQSDDKVVVIVMYILIALL